jgi:hypothetical protein
VFTCSCPWQQLSKLELHLFSTSVFLIQTSGIASALPSILSVLGLLEPTWVNKAHQTCFVPS